jgi:hypothetical protein
MSRNGSLSFVISALLFFFLVALFASPPSFWANVRIFDVELMPIFAMGFFLLFFAVCLAAKGKTIFKNTPLFINQLRKAGNFFGSIYKRICFKAKLFCQFCCDVLNSINHYFSSNALVSLLSFSIRPSAIFWKITKIIVDSVNRKAFWSFAHILQKIGKPFFLFSPSLANSYSPFSVISVMRAIFVKTSTFHASPYSIKRMGVFKWHFQSL